MEYTGKPSPYEPKPAFVNALRFKTMFNSPSRASCLQVTNNGKAIVISTAEESEDAKVTLVGDSLFGEVSEVKWGEGETSGGGRDD